MSATMSTDMTAPGPVRRRGSLLRTLGSVLTVLALVALALAGGLWVGTPAHAADSPILVKMAGENAFSSDASKPLISLQGLAPGGSTSGTMWIQDNSESAAGSGNADTITLKMINVATTDGPSGGPTRSGSGAALEQALDFSVAVSGAGTIPSHGALRVADLSSASGVTLATGLSKGSELELILTASLPGSVENDVQYGQMAFDLELALTTGTVANPGDNTQGNPGAGAVPNAQGGGPAALPPEVKGTSKELPPAAPGNAGSVTKPGKGGVLVLGASKGSLSYTGAPILALAAAGGAIFVIGVAFLLAARRRPRSATAHSGTGGQR